MVCGSVTWQGPETLAGAPLDSEALEALGVLSQQTEGALLISQFEFSVVMRSDHEMILLGTRDDVSFADIVFERESGAKWKPTSFGTCEWTVDGYSAAAWMLRATPEPTDDVIRVMASNNCGLVEDTDDTIAVAQTIGATIRLLILERNAPEPDTGDEQFRSLECPLGLTVELDVRLDTKVGNRGVMGSSSEAEVLGRPSEESGR
jgi:hypothetical protein